MTNSNRVPESTRKANSKAIADRELWRKQYNRLSLVIRKTRRLRYTRTNRVWSEAELETMLRALRVEANFLMDDRDRIATNLRETAYAYI